MIDITPELADALLKIAETQRARLSRMRKQLDQYKAELIKLHEG